MDKQTNWGDLRAWRPGVSPRFVEWPENSNEFEGATINMREVTNANISDGVKRAIREREEYERRRAERLRKGDGF